MNGPQVFNRFKNRKPWYQKLGEWIQSQDPIAFMLDMFVTAGKIEF
jgi:hypothetical protein